MGLSALFALAATKYPDVFLTKMAEMVNDNFEYGDLRLVDVHLYNACLVDDFAPRGRDASREFFVFAKQKHDVNDAAVIFYGDSFIKNIWGAEFERDTGVPAFSHRAKDGQNPLDAINGDGFKRGYKARYMVVECVERNLVSEFDTKRPGHPGVQARPETFDAWFRSRALINEGNLEWLGKSRLGPLLKCRNTLLFRALRYISPITPVYSLDPPILFHSSEVRFNENPMMPNKAADVARVVGGMSRELRKRYAITLIFIPVPNKLSIYGGYAGVRYNGFLPELYRQLDKEDVVYIDLYHDFAVSREMLYHPDGTHWNLAGSDIAMKKLIGLYNALERGAGSN